LQVSAKRLLTYLTVAIALLCVSAIPISHALREGLRPVDSYNSLWIDSFSATIGRGEWRPRWVPEAFDGMGASTFYFYPPLAFYVTTIVDLLTAHRLNAELLAAWGGFGLSLLSSVTMFAWLRRRVGWRTATIGALAYAVAPYHLLDLYGRGSFGELAAYPLLPLFALAFDRTVKSRDGIPFLAATYAGLILSHVAVGLLVSVFVAPVLLLQVLRQDDRGDIGPALRRLALAGLLGLGLSATYLIPALGLQNAASMKWMWGTAADGGNPANWTFFNQAHWPSRPLAGAMAGLACIYGFVAVANVLLPQAAGERRGISRAWATIVLIAIIAYALPWIWEGPLAPIMGKVQFPFRMLVFVEFAAITSVSLATLTPSRTMLILAAVVLLAATPFVRKLLIPEYGLVQGYPANADAVVAGRLKHARAPEEHLPAGFNFDPKIVLSRTYLDGFAGLPSVRPLDPAARVLASSEYPDGSVAAEIDAPRPTLVVVRRFYFPAWRANLVSPGADPVLAVRPYGVSRFAAFAIMPGRHVYRMHIVRTVQEKVGDALTLVSLLAGVSLIVMDWRRRSKKPALGQA
jgi:hypothetical protein